MQKSAHARLHCDDESLARVAKMPRRLAPAGGSPSDEDEDEDTEDASAEDAESADAVSSPGAPEQAAVPAVAMEHAGAAAGAAEVVAESGAAVPTPTVESPVPVA